MPPKNSLEEMLPEAAERKLTHVERLTLDWRRGARPLTEKWFRQMRDASYMEKFPLAPIPLIEYYAAKAADEAEAKASAEQS